MYVCTYVRMYVCIYTCRDIYTDIHTYEYMHLYTHTLQLLMYPHSTPGVHLQQTTTNLRILLAHADHVITAYQIWSVI